MNTNKSYPGSTGSPKVDIILQTLYGRVTNLESWLRCIDKEQALESTLVTDSDHAGFLHLLKTTLVAEEENSKELRRPVSLSQVSHQQEIVVRAVERVLRRDGVGNNVLSFGFGPMTDNPKASVSSVSSIEYRYPNSSINRLQYKVWKTLLTRVGDTLMSHLLENTSIFILLVKPAVYLQVTGKPVYQMWPYSAGSTWTAKRCTCPPRKTPSVKARGTRKPPKVKKKQKQGKHGRSEEVCITRKSQPGAQSPHHHTKQFVNSSSSRQQQCGDAHKLKQPKTGKRKVQCEECAPESKRRKKCDDEKSRHSLLDGSRGDQEATCTKSPAVAESPSVSVTSSPVILCVSEKDSSTSSVDTSHPGTVEGPLGKRSCRGTGSSLRTSHGQIETSQESVRGKTHLGQRCSPAVSPTVVPETSESSVEVTAVVDGSCPPAGEAGKASSLKTKRQKKRARQRKKKLSQRACTATSVPYQYHKYVSRLSLLYGKSLRDKFPKNFCVASLDASEEGARSLLTDIFVRGDVGGNVSKSDQPCQCQATALPLLDKSGQNMGQGQESSQASASSTHNSQVGNYSTHPASQPVRSQESESPSDTESGSRPAVHRQHLHVEDNVKTQNHYGGDAGASASMPMGDQQSKVTLAPLCSRASEHSNAADGARKSMSEESEEKEMEVGDPGQSMIRDSEGSTDTPRDLSYEADASSSGSCSLPCGQRQFTDAPEMPVSVSILSTTSSCTPEHSSQHFPVKDSVKCLDSALVRKASQSSQFREGEDRSTSSDTSPDVVSPSQSNGTVVTPPTFVSSQQTDVEITSAALSQEGSLLQAKQPETLNPAAATQATEDGRTPMQIMLADSSTSVTHEWTSSLRSPMDILLVDSPSVCRTSSKSSSSFAISDPSCGSGFVARSPLLDHSSFYADGSLRDRTMANLDMVGQTPKAAQFEGEDTHQSVPAASRSVDGKVSGEAWQKDAASAGRELREAGAFTLGAERGASTSVSPQKPAMATCCEEGENSGTEAVGRGTSTELPVLLGLQTEVLPLLQQLLHNHRNCRHWALLTRHCQSALDTRITRQAACSSSDKKNNPMSGGDTGKPGSGRLLPRSRARKSPTTAKLLEDHISHSRVFAFLKAVVKCTVPPKLLGPSANMALFLKNVKTLVSAGKFEKLCLGQLMRGIKVRECVWLRGVACHKEREHRMAQLLWWLVNSFLFSVITAFFYLTDASTFRNRVLYYRKQTWLRLQTKAMQDFRQRTKLQNISETTVKEWLASGQTLGVSVLRFLPKARSLRPIVNMSSKPRSNSQQQKSINKQLMKLFQALTFEKTLDGSISGCSVFGTDDIYLRLRQFKADRASRQDHRCLYFVKTDISKCFDSIQPQLLFSVVKAILTKDDEQTYITRKYASVYLAGKRLKRVFHSDTTRLSCFQPDFSSFVRQQCSGGRFGDILLVDQAMFHHETTASLLQVLSFHLFKNVIKLGQRHYLQCTGVSQGSMVSTLLVSIYLAHLEARHLPVLSDELLIRMMDDYLFLTPHRPRAQHFLEVMKKGFPDYNCFINADKILTNFPVVQSPAGVIVCTEPGEPFPWCGLNINTGSLEVSVDYSRYSGLCITDTATFDASYKAGQTLQNKLMMCLKIKCHVIFFDPMMNSEERVLVNVYRVFLFAALIFHSFVVKLPPSRRVDHNPRFFSNTVEMVPSYLHTLVTRKLKQAKSLHQFPVQLQVLQWMTADAFLARLHHHPGYKPLKKFLRARRRSLQKKMGEEEVMMLRAALHAGLDRHSNMALF